MKDNLFYICLFLVIIIFLAILLSHNNILFQILINLILTGSFLYIIYDYIISKKKIDKQNFKKMYNLYNRQNKDYKLNNYNLSNLNMMNNTRFNKKNIDKTHNLRETDTKLLNDKEITKLINEINFDNIKSSKNQKDKSYDEDSNLSNDNTPIYDNLENLKRLNYYSSQGLDCAYDLQFNKDFSNFKDIYNLTGCNGDTKLANRMKFMSLKDKFAKENRAAYDRSSIQHLFTDELNIEEKRIWWENPDIYDSAM